MRPVRPLKMLRSILLLAALAACHGAVLEMGDGKMDEVKAHPVLVKFYAPWCGHCKKLVPTWDELAAKVEKEGQTGLVSIAKVDCTADGKETCKTYGVKGFPTLKLLYPISTPDGAGTVGEVAYKGARTLDALYKFAIEASQNPSAYVAKAKKEQEEADKASKIAAEKAEAEAVANNKDAVVKQMTKSNFDDFVHKEAPVTFVKFYAPWCGHCKKLAPTWDQLGAAFKDDASVTIAKADCTVHKELCQKHGVRGYPTLLAFINGESTKYEGGRDLTNLSDFVKDKKPAATAA